MYKYKFPMNLQLFAESQDNAGANAGDKSGIDVDALMSQVATLQAETARQKAAIDKLTKANGELTKSYRNSLDEAGRAKLDAENAQAERDQQLADMQRQLSTYQAKERYLSIGMDAKLAAETAQAEIDGDMAKVAANYERLLKSVREGAVQDFLNKRGTPAGGNGGQSNESEAMKLAKRLAGQTTQRTLDEDALKKWSK